MIKKIAFFLPLVLSFPTHCTPEAEVDEKETEKTMPVLRVAAGVIIAPVLGRWLGYSYKVCALFSLVGGTIMYAFWTCVIIAVCIYLAYFFWQGKNPCVNAQNNLLDIKDKFQIKAQDVKRTLKKHVKEIKKEIRAKVELPSPKEVVKKWLFS